MKKHSKVFHAVLFLAIGILFFQIVQEVMTPRWVWPQFKESTENTLAELRALEGSDIQTFFLGPSTTLYSIDPMRIYEQNGIVTYNLGTSAQQLTLSYYVLAEGFKTARPDYVLLEAAGLFPGAFESSRYHYVLDGMPLSENKIALARAYAENFPEEERTGEFFGVFLPIYQYHDRWEDLWKNDFVLTEKDLNYYTKGYYLNTITNSSGMNMPWHDEIAQTNATTDGWTERLENGETVRTEDTKKLYAPSVQQKELDILLDIKALCEENGAELRLVKMPQCREPQYYATTWTKIKSDIVKELAAENGIPFIDLNYDVDLGMNWSLDSCDGGTHLNYRGAKKVTDFIAGYLAGECGLVGHCDESYEADRPVYDAVMQVAELQMTRDLSTYLERASEFDGVTVFFSASDDMMRHLSEEDRNALSAFGLNTDFNGLSYSDSYLAVKENCKVVYEASSNRKISKTGTLDCGSAYSIVSSGWYSKPQSTIKIDGTDYSMNHRGINIVVYSNRAKMVLDSVAFDTWNDGSQSGIRNTAGTTKYSPLGSGINEAYLLNFEYYLMENGVE